jgi:hypothetical protein
VLYWAAVIAAGFMAIAAVWAVGVGIFDLGRSSSYRDDAQYAFGGAAISGVAAVLTFLVGKGIRYVLSGPKVSQKA